METLPMLEREVPEPFVVEPWWQRFGSMAMALLHQIARRPTDPAPRLVLADFLEEAGESDRAEFIRLQVREMPSRSNVVEIDDILLTVRERVLLARHRAEWLAGLPEEIEWFFWGGLVEGVVVSSEEQWQQARKYVDVRRLAWRGGEGFLSIVRNASGMRGVVALDLSSNRIGDARVQALAQSPHLQNLASLNLTGNKIGGRGVQALAQSPPLNNLNSLGLWENESGAEGREALRNSPYLQRCNIRF
jgi:uncharacterized protein (TIGR02996 family)